MSTSRMTLGAVLGTVQTTANTVTATLEAANAAVGMLNTFVTGAAENQRIRAIADQETFIEDLIREKSYEEAQSGLKVEKFIAQSASHKTHYASAYEKFTGLLRKQEA
jgi:hypothetical protein